MKRIQTIVLVVVGIASFQVAPYLPLFDRTAAPSSAPLWIQQDSARLSRVLESTPRPKARPAKRPAPRPVAVRSVVRAPVRQKTTVATTTRSTASSQMFSMINSARSSRGLAALRWNGTLAAGATSHSRSMASRGSIYHSSGSELLSNGRSACGCSTAGEVVGSGSSMRAIFNAFMAHGAHRDMILNRSFRYAGVGVVYSGGKYWVTVRFAG